MEDETQKEWFGALPIAGLVRRARRIADMSQRQLARAAGVSQSAVSRMETEGLVPSLGLLQRVLGAAGLSLVVADAQGHVVQPMADWDNTRDGAERRYPSHLDTVLDPKAGEWWADIYGLARPPETYYRNREFRDQMRRRSQWEVRVSKYRHVPPPPNPVLRRWRQEWLQSLSRMRPMAVASERRT